MTSLARVRELSDTDIQAWLGKIGVGHVRDLEIALLEAEAAVKDRIYRNMSSRASAALKADMRKLAAKPIRSEDIRAKAAMLESWI